MVETTTIAETLTHVFANLEQAIPSHPADGISLLSAWTGVLGGHGRTSSDVVISISQIAAAFRKLEQQVRVSKKLKAPQKLSALQTLGQLSVFFQIERLYENATPYRAHCSETVRGTLGMIGHSLESEFSEPRLERPDADDIATALKKIKSLLEKSDISFELCQNLVKHLDVMLWWLDHPEMANLQDLFETMGSVMVIANQIKDRDPEPTSASPTVNKTLYENVLTIAQRFGTLLRVVTRGVETANKVGGDVHRLLENINPPA